MDCPLITMEPEAAKAKLAAYRDAQVNDVGRLYDECLAGYEKLAKGCALIDIDEAIRAGGFDEKMRPKLAIARADRPVVKLHWRGNSTTPIFDATIEENGYNSRGLRAPNLTVRVDVQRLHGQKCRHPVGGWETTDLEAFARVPMIPADVRPKRGQRKSWHILWEVEQWSDRPLAPPPRDPYLLQHIGGSLYAVLAEWNLTDLEIAVMRQVTR